MCERVCEIERARRAKQRRVGKRGHFRREVISKREGEGGGGEEKVRDRFERGRECDIQRERERDPITASHSCFLDSRNGYSISPTLNATG